MSNILDMMCEFFVTFWIFWVFLLVLAIVTALFERAEKKARHQKAVERSRIECEERMSELGY